MSKWYYQTDGQQEAGPVTAARLKELARSNQLAPTDLVRQDGTDRRVPAARVKGLFDPAGSPAVTTDLPPAPTQDVEPATGSTLPPWLGRLQGHPALLVVSLTCCFPAGLYLIWSNKSWPTRRKATWTGVWAAVVVTMIAVSSAQQAAARKSFDEAERLWAAGQKAEAVEKYKGLIDDSLTSMEPSARPVAFQRVIEYEAEGGNASTAKLYAVKAGKFNVPVSSDAPAAARVLGEVKAEREEAERKEAAEREAAERKKAAEDGADKGNRNPASAGGDQTQGDYKKGYETGYSVGQQHAGNYKASPAAYKSEQKKLYAKTLMGFENSRRDIERAYGPKSDAAEQQRGQCDGYRKALVEAGIIP